MNGNDSEKAMLNASSSTLSKFGRVVATFARSETGVTSIEYALIGALIAVAIVVSVTNVGSAVSSLYQFVADKVAEALP